MLVRLGDQRTVDILNNIILSVYGHLHTVADAASDLDCALALRSNWQPQVMWDTHTHTYLNNRLDTKESRYTMCQHCFSPMAQLAC